MKRSRKTGLWFSLGVILVTVGCGKSSSPNVPEAPAPATPAMKSQQDVNAAKAPTTTVATPPSTALQKAAAEAAEQGDPIIVIHTSLGSLFVRLYEHAAPRTVANFLDYARMGHYDRTIFHRVEPGFMIMAGSLDQQMAPKPVRYPIANEANNGLKNVRGALAMARDPREKDGATAQFFINLADNPKLNYHGESPDQYGYCVFGQIIDGLDVLDKLEQVETGTIQGFEKMPVKSIVLNTIKLIR